MRKNFKILIAGKNNVAVETAKVLLTIFGIDGLTLVFLKSEVNPNGYFDNFAEYAKENKFNCIEIDDTEKNCDEAFLGALKLIRPDLVISAQFSLIIRQSAIDFMNGNILNLHFSSLPRYRGVAPITRAIRDGNKTHGVTLHAIDKGIDTGNIIAQQDFPIRDLTNRQVYDLCTIYGAILIKSHILHIVDEISKRGSFLHISKKQDHSQSTYFAKDVALYTNRTLDGNFSAGQGYQKALSLIFEPILYPEIEFEGERLKVVSAWPELDGELCNTKHGIVDRVADNQFRLSTRDFWIKLWTLKINKISG